MVKKKRPIATWRSILPGNLDPSRFTLDELRSAKAAHAFLTEKIEGPPGFAEYMRAYRFLLFFGIVCVVEDKYPAFTRCWKEIEALFTGDPMFEDGVFAQSWVLMDFPFGPERQTALDYFEEFLEGTEVGPGFQRLIDEARKSRLGLYYDVGRTKTVASLRELLSGRTLSAVPSTDGREPGEILLIRAIRHGDQVFLWGDPKSFSGEMKGRIETMVRDKLFYFSEEPTPEAQFEAFMKRAGPYWMSCVTKNDAIPILDPDHYRTYLADRA
ncbi:hypothetical protein [Sorangium sp. So ce124]|uniref:hypothetical protein n=1 Tax=Sorangium sp. So ce124 TaxID=3133280 RepID=UPI003F63ACBB